ncbi:MULTISPECIES: ABC-three component system middle component 6 [Methylobacteriaceae]|uniref:ABC-three component system middle component 6 n=1 Tax=Methylobacteriaceae TaxID=119045 RepID=UPI000CDA8A34|nr:MULTISPECIES: ABC-three component system middle component 6 [Methylobacteriaceae]MCP1549375.1 hypothetical protein [Methylorubrum zatmanii]MCP1554012.1 hypothetical protein [Methylorubrum extorquens]MCP1579677.1 hypothetical protein [Methylorubrum extorquens]POR41032.1 hypothetical protein CRT23_20565 [Methylobacterium sp. V23]
MILPSKHLSQDRALIGVGADILEILTRPMTVSEAWDGVRKNRASRPDSAVLPFDWFVLAMCLLRALGALDLNDEGLLVRAERKP